MHGYIVLEIRCFLFYQSVPDCYTLFHPLAVYGIEVGGVVGESGERLGEVA